MPSGNDLVWCGDEHGWLQHAAACLCLTIVEHDAASLVAETAAARSEEEFIAVLCLFQLLYRRHFGERKARGGNRNYDLVCRKMEKKPKQFRSNFRMDPKTFSRLWERLWRDRMDKFNESRQARKSAGSNSGGRKPSERTYRRRLYMTIWFLANGCSYRSVGEQFGYNCNFELLLIREIARLAPEYIVFPTAEDDIIYAANQFRALRGFKHCLGAIDGTFIRILAPWKSGRAKVRLYYLCLHHVRGLMLVR